MAPSDNCEKAHLDLRDKAMGLERDLESIQRLLEAVTSVLRDNLVTLAGHDRAAQEMRTYLVGVAQDLQDRVKHLELSIGEWRGFQEAMEDAFGKVDRVESELMSMYGLDPGRTPNPLAVKIQEALALLRELADKDTLSGQPLRGIDYWWKKLGHVLQTAVAIGIVAAIWTILKSYIAQALAGR